MLHRRPRGIGSGSAGEVDAEVILRIAREVCHVEAAHLERMAGRQVCRWCQDDRGQVRTEAEGDSHIAQGVVVEVHVFSTPWIDGASIHRLVELHGEDSIGADHLAVVDAGMDHSGRAEIGACHGVEMSRLAGDGHPGLAGDAAYGDRHRRA